MATILITGGHGGIGLACSKYLASNYHLNLVLAGRSIERMKRVAEELHNAYGVKVTPLKLDTSSMESVRLAAQECRELIEIGEIDSLQGIICNAGISPSLSFKDMKYSVDGYEEIFATNYLGHFLLVQLLQDLITPNGRIVNTVSGTHDPDTVDGKVIGSMKPDALMLANIGKDGKKMRFTGKLYGTSKLCLIMNTYELDRRFRKASSTIEAIAFDPGMTMGTSFMRGLPKPLQRIANSKFSTWLMKRSGMTIGNKEFSGENLAKIAADPSFSHSSGKYFQSNDGTLIEKRSSKLSYDQQLSLKLWDDSKKLVHLSK